MTDTVFEGDFTIEFFKGSADELISELSEGSITTTRGFSIISSSSSLSKRFFLSFFLLESDLSRLDLAGSDVIFKT